MYLPRFTIRQRLTIGVNRYQVNESAEDGSVGRLMAVAQQKRLALKEQVTFYADEATGRERNQAVAVLRRIVDFPFAFHFDFHDPEGRLVLSSERQLSLRDRYVVTVPDPRLDFRLAAAMAVGLDALLAR